MTMRDDRYGALLERGWMVVDLPDPGSVLAVRDRLLERLRMLLGSPLERLEDYHTAVDDDARHLDVLYELASTFWDQQHGVELVRANLSLVEQLAGSDLHVQSYPYLRVTRPNR